MKNILVTSKDLKNNNWEAIEQLLKTNRIQAIFNEKQEAMSAEDICSVCSKNKIEGIIVYSSSDEVNDTVFENCRDLKVVSRHGVGTENIDVKVARKYGVQVRTTKDLYDYETVADLAFGLMLCLARKIARMDRALREKNWLREVGNDVWGKTLGIVGLGRIGKALARRASGFKMKVLSYDPYVDDSVRENGIKMVDLNLLLKESDFISLHMPLTKETYHIIDSDQFELMKNTAYLINTARADLINQEVLLEVLKKREIAGAAVDVYSIEPAVKDPLIESNLVNLVYTPHVGSYTIENLKQMDYAVFKNAVDVITNRM
ncbi:MAG TPA: phosphoglycerate dehydrogenase [Thermoanaerobacterales bacterium]|jgi:lactate dehydrogenase-like 2-hydroxyacid dehydrogenase|nr:phosphoglycerate dehydrogenase [Thermoanaerobacterales bacterium]